MATRFESPISFVTRSSSPTTPSSGYGVVYARGSNLYYEDDTGTEYLLNRAGSTVIRQYTGSAFWIKPPEIVEVLVCCLGAGGGGGSGRVSAAGVNATGGLGGGGGAAVYRKLSASQLTAVSYSISVGAGGAGGGSQTTDSTNGLGGASGTSTVFAISGSTTLVLARAGGAGPAGTTAAGSTVQNGGDTANTTPAGGWYGFCGQSGGGSAPGPGSTPATRFMSNGGGGGGGVSSLNSPGNGGLGCNLVITGSTFNNSGRGTVASPDATTNTSVIRTDFLFNYIVTDGLQFGLGFAGNGGAGQTTANGGSGSAAAPYTGGGGGGGGCRDGFDSGPGGRGADGLVTIVEFY